MNFKFSMKKICKALVLVAIMLIIPLFFAISASAASTPYEVTKSGGAWIRPSYSESSGEIRKAPEGSILWVVGSKKNSAGNLWYKLSDGYWIYSGNVKAHSCSWSQTGKSNPTCTSAGVTHYKCYKCGQTKQTTTAAYGHSYSGNVCTRCGVWNTSSLKSRTSVNNVKYYVTTNGAKVHNGPYGACATIATLNKGNEIIVTEKLVNASGNTWYKYSGGYIFEDYVVKHSSCSWNSGVVTKNATCTSTGTKVYTCTICSATKTTTISKTSHKYSGHVCTACGTWDTSSLKSRTSVSNVEYYVTTNGAKVHSGPYGACATVKTLNKGNEIIVTEKVVNASGNVWYKYSGGYIFEDYVVKHSSCKWDSGKVTKAATCTATGTRVYTCKICGGTKTVKIAKLDHKYSSNVCTACGYWNPSKLKSSTSVNNVKYYVTAKAKVHSGPYGACATVKTLSKGTEIVVTEKIVNASGNVWYKYSGGYIFEDYVVKHSSCKWNSGTVTKKATCTSTGSKVCTCTICGKQKTVTIEKTKHSYSDHVCKKCGAWDTSSLKSKTTIKSVSYCVVTNGAKVHSGPYAKSKTTATLAKGKIIKVTEKVVNASGNVWYKYSGGYIYGDYVVKHTSCMWDSGKITKKPTCTATGTKVQTCAVCAKQKVTVLPKHKFKSNVCTECGAWDTSSLQSKTTVKNVEYCVVTEGAKVHSGPYAKSKTTATLAKGKVIKVTEKVVNAGGNTWYKYSGGYIFGDYVTKHVYTYGVCQSCGKKQDGTLATAKFKGTISKQNTTVAVDFDNQLFLEDSTTFSNAICRISAAGMAASYNVTHGKNFLINCGFDPDTIQAANSSSKKSVVDTGKNDHARYIIGHQTIDGTNITLVGVLINGYTTGSYEWVSNFNVGKSGLHKGFSTAANEVTEKINAYIKAQKIDTKNMKIWLTGHSRGGVVTGMTAANLNYKYGVENVFAYGFATPNGVPTSMANSVPNKTSAKVCTDNIFNIVNKGDFVPYVVPESWGFTKYGRTIELGVGDATKSVYKAIAKDTYGGLSINKRKDIINAFCEYSANRKEYNQDKNFWGLTPSKFGEAIGMFMAGKDDLGTLLQAAGAKLSLAWELKENKGKITEAHCVEAYLALVNAQNPSKHVPAKSS